MTGQEAIKIHIEECKHRVGVINMYLETGENIDDEIMRESEENIVILKAAITALEEIQQYRAIGTVKECREAVEKQQAKKPVIYRETNRADCPSCGNTVRGIKEPFGNWCSKCGKKIEWSK